MWVRWRGAKSIRCLEYNLWMWSSTDFLRIRGKWLVNVPELWLYGMLALGRSVQGHYPIASYLCSSLELRSRSLASSFGRLHLETENSHSPVLALAHLSLRFIDRDEGQLHIFKEDFGAWKYKVLSIGVFFYHSNCFLNAGGDVGISCVPQARSLPNSNSCIYTSALEVITDCLVLAVCIYRTQL